MHSLPLPPIGRMHLFFMILRLELSLKMIIDQVVLIPFCLELFNVDSA
jgi:hypothetical protein